MESLGNTQRGPNMYEKAGFFLRNSHWYVISILQKGRRKTLEQEDIYEISAEEEAKKVAGDLESHWEKELLRKEHGKRPRLTVALMKFASPAIFLFGIIVVAEEIFGVLQTLLLGWLLDYFSADSKQTLSEAYLYAAGVGLCSFAFVLLHNPYFFLNQRIGLRLKVAMTSMIYKKAMRLSSSALHVISSGKIINLISTDVQRIEAAPMMLHYVWIGPLDAIAVSVILWYQLGPACMAGIGFMILFIPLNVLMARLYAKIRAKVVTFTDERVKVMNEVISGMRVIKMYGWEDSFAKLVTGIRRKEIGKLRRVMTLKAINYSLFTLVPYLVSLLIFTTYVLLGNKLTVAKVFSSLTLLQKLRLPLMIFFPLALQQLGEGYISVGRIQDFLDMEEVKEITYKHSHTEDDHTVKLENVCATWGESIAPTLQDIDLKLDSANHLVMVIGGVGSGKSSLLMTLLGELKASTGSVSVPGNIGYVAQEPWVFSGSVRQNILFGKEFRLDWYNRVLEACCLNQDLEQLTDGDASIVGERGVSLSGGQKARVALARAVYADADIYLLDDPLSAVDARVGREILQNCICGLLQEKLCVLVTHQLQFLQAATEIICLKGGKITMRGTYDELKEREVDLVSLISEEMETNAADINEHRERKRRKSCSRSVVSALSQSCVALPEMSLDQLSDDEEEDELEVVIKTGEEMKRDKEVRKALVPAEARSAGSIKVYLYVEYFKAGAGVIGSLLVILLVMVGQINLFIVDWWLAVWAKGQEQVSFVEMHNKTFSAEYYFSNNENINIYIFVGLTLLALILNLARVIAFYSLILRASKRLHNLMFKKILMSPIYFFDTNPVGRVLNRFSKDIFYMDDLMCIAFFDFFQFFFLTIGIVIVNIIVTPIVIGVVIPLLVIFIFLRSFFIKSSREIRRLEAVARSPLFSHLSASLQGLITIRAYRMQDDSISEFYRCQNYQSEGWMMFLHVTRWFAIQADSTCSFFLTAVSLIVVVVSQYVHVDAAVAGLALSYATGLTGMVQWAVRQSCEVENMMTSVERVIEYTKLAVEPETKTFIQPPDDWPNSGGIEVQDAVFRYHKDLPPVLKGITFTIQEKEKVGIVGRTGAGKSSLMALLFRMADFSGKVVIDGITTKDLLLKDLRRKIAVIPQDPVLFCGPLRKNLDPFDEFSDNEIWSAIEEVQLVEAVSQLPQKLMTQLAEAGANFSVGQKQLICLARAILRRNKILFVDEATANVDADTDQLIQETIHQKFEDCTVLTIAHRLNTIMDSDRVMVLDNGLLVEFDEPYLLLKDGESVFADLVRQTGKNTEEKLCRLAKEAYDFRHGEGLPLAKKSVSEAFFSD